MRHLSAVAQAWIGLVLLAGCAAFALAVAQAGQLETQLSSPAVAVLLVGACVAHAFPAVAPRHQAYHATQAFLMAAVLLLSWPAVAVIVIAAHVIEWVRRPRPWYIQFYNIAVYLLSAGAAQAALTLSGALPFDVVEPPLILAALASAAVLLLVNHGLTAIVLRLARGISVADSGLFGRESLGLDGTLLAIGIAMAGGWRAQPLMLVVTAAPLLLISRALRLTNVETVSHRDELTGLYNMRHFLEATDLELRRAERLRHATGMIVAVLDDVPGIVQRSGRASLDFLVAHVGQRMSATLREYDIVARLDEGTLGLLLPTASQDEVNAVA
jgi:GGDEF domain-containing protein